MNSHDIAGILDELIVAGVGVDYDSTSRSYLFYDRGSYRSVRVTVAALEAMEGSVNARLYASAVIRELRHSKSDVMPTSDTAPGVEPIVANMRRRVVIRRR